MRRPRARLLGVLAATLLLAGCSAAGAAAPTWVPQPSFTGDGGTPQTFGPQEGSNAPSSGSGSGSGAPAPGSPGSTSTTGPAIDPQVVAKKLTTPTGVAILPDNTALVGERSTGRIYHVRPVAGQPVPLVRTLTGIDFKGDGGLLDLAISPTYPQDGLIYAYLSTATDNRVVHFTLTGAATVVLSGIPKGSSGNAGRLMFDAAGNLYIGTGNAGQPALATNPASLAGKILRVNDIGQPLADNLAPNSPVYASGLSSTDGLCHDTQDSAIWQDEAGSGTGATAVPDEINIVSRGADYATAAGTPLPAHYTAVGGCAVIGGQFYITSRDGKALLTATITKSGSTVKLGSLTVVGTNKYGRLLTVAAAPDGSLWLTTTNKDGHGTPVPDDERVIRIIPPPPAGANSPL
jgi:glucose/arabinose dehydrogenase